MTTDQDTANANWRSWWRQHCRSVSPRHRYDTAGNAATVCCRCGGLVCVGASARKLCDACEALLRDQRV